MVRRPNTSDTLVDTQNRLLSVLQFLPTCLLEQISLLKDLLWFKVSDANGLLSPIYIMPLNDGMLVRSRRNTDFNLRVRFREGREVMF